MGIQRCNRSGLPGPARLEPGSYQIYAMKIFSRMGDDTHKDLVVAGGPWTIQLK